MPDSTHPTGKWLPTEAWFRIATRAAAIGVWEWDLATGAMRYSSVARQIFGFTPTEEITIEKVRATTHPEDHPWTSARARRALDPAIREPAEFEYRIRRYDTDEERWIYARGEAMFGIVDGVEQAVRYVGTVHDITDEKAVAKRLEQSEARLRLAIEAAGLAVWEVDTLRGTIAGSPDLNRLFGLPADARPTLEDLRALYAPGERERIEAEAAQVLARGETNIQTILKLFWPDGTPHWLLVRAQAVSGSGPEERRAIGVLMDVTRQKLQEERLEAVAREMHHRIKNLLAVVGAIAGQSLRDTPDTAAALAALNGRLRALSLATDMILIRGQSAGDLGALVEAVVEPFRFHNSRRFLVRGDALEVPAAAMQGLAMALHELCTNAVKYGALSVEDGCIELGWERSGRSLSLTWRERGGRGGATNGEPGYGTRLLRALFAPPDELVFQLRPDGVECSIRVCLPDQPAA